MRFRDQTATSVAGYDDFRGQGRPKHARAIPLVLALTILVNVVTARAQDAASPIPYSGHLSLGPWAPDVQIRVETDAGDTRIRVSTGGRTAEQRFPGQRSHARAQVVAGAGVVRAEGGPGPIAALVVVRHGRPEILWSGRLYPHGDPGEQVADVIEIADRTGDGRDDVIVGQQRQGVGLCGRPPALLFPRALDPRTGTLRPVVLPRLPSPETTDAEVAVSATTDSPGPTGPPIVRALAAVGASSQANAGDDASQLEPPRALVDGDPSTAWTEGRGGHGEGEIAVLRFGGGMPIRALALVAPAAGRLPASVVVAGDAAPRLRATIPAVPAGGRAWIVPPEPLAWGCFAVVLAEPGGDAGARIAIADVEVYTDVDFGGGIDALVAELVRDGPAGDRTTDFLSRLGEPAVRALDASWERLGARGRERATRVASEPARSGNEAALALLGRAAGDEHSSVRAAALEALARSGGPGRARIVTVAAQPGAAGEDAARTLADAEDRFDLAPLLAAASARGGSERPWLRAAVARSLAFGRSEDATALERWENDAPIAARASIALGLAENEATRGLAVDLAHRARDGATEFADRWRLARAIAAVDTGEGEITAFEQRPDERRALDAWLGGIARQADEWMLREQALRALGSRDLEVARAALADRYPRVRAAAVEALAASAADVERLLGVLRSDRWPAVRVAAMDALADRPDQRRALVAALDDDAQMVRRRAIEHLTRLRDRGAAQPIAARLRDGNEWPIVIEAALEYVEELCVAEAGEATLEVIRRGIRPHAWEPHVEAAVRALRIAQRLGGATAEDARAIAGRGDERMQAALAQEPPEPCAPR